MRHKSVETKMTAMLPLALNVFKSWVQETVMLAKFEQTCHWPFRVLHFLVLATLEFVQGNRK